MHKADSRARHGICVGYVWRSIEYLVATQEGVFKCRTVRRRVEELAYDPECTDDLTVAYDDYVMKGGKTAPAERFPGPNM